MIETADADSLVRFFCCDPQNARFGPFAPPPALEGGPNGTVLIPGTMWRYRVADEERRPVDLHVCAGLGEGAGTLWDLEAHALSRLGARGLPGLPEVLDAGYVPADETGRVVSGAGGLAVVAARAAERSLADERATARLANDPRQAVRVLMLLADALAELHAQGMTHGSLWPGAVYTTDTTTGTGEVGAESDYWLARFEMSSLLANHALVGHRPGPGDADEADRYAAPETFQGREALGPDQVARADVYSLAAIAVRWFAGEQAGTDALERVAARAPAVLTRVLADMLAEPERRSSAAEAAWRLREAAPVLAVSWDPPSDRQPHLVFYLAETGRTLHHWGWLAAEPGTAAGAQEIRALLDADLQHAALLYSPTGAAPFVPTPLQAAGEARYVLLGERAAWFCVPYRPASLWFRAAAASPWDALLVKYCVPRPVRLLEAQLAQAPRVRLPAIETAPVPPAEQQRESATEGRPSWKPLADALSPRLSTEDALFDEALAWLLDYQSVVLQARCHACVIVNDGMVVKASTDTRRDQDWVYRHSLLTQYAQDPRSRPALGDLAAELDPDEGRVMELLGDRDGRPDTAGHRSRWYAEPAGPDRVLLRPASPDNKPPPERGWLRPAGDAAALAQLRAQSRACEELKHMPRLRAQLRNPQARRSGGRRWLSATEGLPGQAAAAMKEMLELSPLYALQGPPGTGKTTIVAKAVAAWLREEPSSRVLVSAQSNSALDTLAERILTELGEMDADGRPTDCNVILALRPAAAQGLAAHPALRPWQAPELAMRLARRARDEVNEALLDSGLDPAVRPVLRQWRSVLEDDRVLPELVDGLTRSANLVFSTCAMSRPEVVSPHREHDLFDWTVVEEAARAWPTELALPLTRAARWTLVGDHHQLPAYGRDRLGRFLDSVTEAPSSGVHVSAERRDAYLKVYDLFQSLFEARPGSTSVDRPLRRLVVQYRMAEPIARLVGESFYPLPDLGDGRLASGLLTVPHRPHPLTDPPALAGRSLVWVDTHGRPECRDEPAWANPGEALLVARLVESMRPPPAFAASGGDTGELAVLTPYRRQLQLLRQSSALADRAATVHAFQGREAETVVVSLVRDTRRVLDDDDLSCPWRSLGHLSQDQLVNVLLSRARSLLVLVGDFRHFARYEDTVWGRICRTVRDLDAVVPADGLFPPQEG